MNEGFYNVPLQSIPPLIMSALAFFMGAHYLIIYFTNRKIRVNLTFSFMCFAIATYNISCVGNYNSETYLQGYEWQRMQLFTLSWVAIGLLLYITDYTNIKNKTAMYFFTIFFSICGLVQLVDRSNLTWIVSQPNITTFDFLGKTITYNEVAQGILTDIQGYGLLFFFTYVYWLSFYYFWKKDAKKGLPLMLAVIVFFLSLCEDVLVSAGLYDFIYTIEYGYIGFLLIMGHSHIMDHTNIQTRLRASEESNRALLESLNQRMFHKDNDGIYVSCNNNYALDLGIEPEEIEGKTDFDFFSKELAEKYRNDDKEIIKSGNAIDVEEKYVLAGREFMVQCVKTPVRNNKDEIIGVMGIFWDITERKKAEETLELTQFSIDRTSVNIFWLDIKGRFIYVNDQASQSLGYTRDELLSMHVWDIDPLMPQERWPARWRDLKQKGTSILEMIHRRKDQSEFPVEIHANYIQHAGKEYIFAFARDTTERKKAEEALIESENRFRTLFESASDAIFLMKDENFVDCNSATLEMFGCERHEIIDHTPIEFSSPMQPDGRKSYEKALEKIKDAFSGQPQRFYWKHKQLDGTLFDAEVSLNLVELSSGPHLQAMVRNITEHRKADEILRRERDFNKKLIHSSPMFFVGIDGEGKVIMMNPAMLDILGYSEDEVLGKDYLANFVPDEEKEPLSRIFKILTTSNSPTISENRMLAKDGRIFLVEWHGRPIFSEQGNFEFFFGLGIDITERRKFEEALKQALREKETLLNEVHHRVKNNLLTLYSLVNLQKISLQGKEDVERALEDTKQRISAMGKVHRMLYMSKNFSEIDFSEYIRSLIDEIQITYGMNERRVEIKSNLEPIALNIDTAIPCGLIVNELLVNAFRHAFPDYKNGRVMVSLVRKGKAIELKVQDNGIGIEGNPFSARSKSLGLRLVMMLSQQLNGEISYSGKKGSLFTIVFKSATI